MAKIKNDIQTSGAFIMPANLQKMKQQVEQGKLPMFIPKLRRSVMGKALAKSKVSLPNGFDPIMLQVHRSLKKRRDDASIVADIELGSRFKIKRIGLVESLETQRALVSGFTRTTAGYCSGNALQNISGAIAAEAIERGDDAVVCYFALAQEGTQVRQQQEFDINYLRNSIGFVSDTTLTNAAKEEVIEKRQHSKVVEYSSPSRLIIFEAPDEVLLRGEQLIKDLNRSAENTYEATQVLSLMDTIIWEFQQGIGGVSDGLSDYMNGVASELKYRHQLNMGWWHQYGAKLAGRLDSKFQKTKSMSIDVMDQKLGWEFYPPDDVS